VACNQKNLRFAALASGVDATREAVQLALVPYDTELTDFNNVMTMQRYLSLVNSQFKQPA
jgi:hypothetical protein